MWRNHRAEIFIFCILSSSFDSIEESRPISQRNTAKTKGTYLTEKYKEDVDKNWKEQNLSRGNLDKLWAPLLLLEGFNSLKEKKIEKTVLNKGIEGTLGKCLKEREGSVSPQKEINSLARKEANLSFKDFNSIEKPKSGKSIVGTVGKYLKERKRGGPEDISPVITGKHIFQEKIRHLKLGKKARLLLEDFNSIQERTEKPTSNIGIVGTIGKYLKEGGKGNTEKVDPEKTELSILQENLRTLLPVGKGARLLLEDFNSIEERTEKPISKIGTVGTIGKKEGEKGSTEEAELYILQGNVKNSQKGKGGRLLLKDFNFIKESTEEPAFNKGIVGTIGKYFKEGGWQRNVSNLPVRKGAHLLLQDLNSIEKRTMKPNFKIEEVGILRKYFKGRERGWPGRENPEPGLDVLRGNIRNSQVGKGARLLLKDFYSIEKTPTFNKGIVGTIGKYLKGEEKGRDKIVPSEIRNTLVKKGGSLLNEEINSIEERRASNSKPFFKKKLAEAIGKYGRENVSGKISPYKMNQSIPRPIWQDYLYGTNKARVVFEGPIEIEDRQTEKPIDEYLKDRENESLEEIIPKTLDQTNRQENPESVDEALLLFTNLNLETENSILEKLKERERESNEELIPNRRPLQENSKNIYTKANDNPKIKLNSSRKGSVGTSRGIEALITYKLPEAVSNNHRNTWPKVPVHQGRFLEENITAKENIVRPLDFIYNDILRQTTVGLESESPELDEDEHDTTGESIEKYPVMTPVKATLTSTKGIQTTADEPSPSSPQAVDKYKYFEGTIYTMATERNLNNTEPFKILSEKKEPNATPILDRRSKGKKYTYFPLFRDLILKINRPQQ